MVDTLRSFVDTTLFEASSCLLEKLNIKFDRETAEPISIADLYDGPMPKYLVEINKLIDKTYFIGVINDSSLKGGKDEVELSEVAETMKHEGKYDGMFVFACDMRNEANLTRSSAAALTRAFNRIASANPVILIIRQGKFLSLATCERMDYTQEWRQGTGEKLGKVTILRNINCEQPHRGHVEILNSIGDKAYSTFEDLYKHWLEVFSSELLTKKFYGELSDWYAWAVQVAKFPNDINTTTDDEKYNHEACIRLITRLIFVWFLKQKRLIPDEFFDEKYIKENFIKNFDPHNKQSLYNAEDSKYYRLILQNLFFAMLNCPIVAEGKDKPNNRRFRASERFQGKNKDYGINNLMRYELEFMEGGAAKFVKLANTNVPFLNGGLFDCLDDKPRGIYYDGFSENPKSLAQLSLPDYLFFGDEVGAGIDLSKWYDDTKKKNVSAIGLIDILKKYSFTIEENTPYDQEVSLDPELLGKVFENLLAAFNPETKTSARKQTGSFYTPREIVQYMVDESLVAHLKRICGADGESQYRQLLSYASPELELSKERKKEIMNAIYNCRVLDPACGSGAFPMGVLQQMVHILKRIDPTNEAWSDLMIDIALADAKKEFLKAADNDAEKAKAEENRKARLADIEEAFNQNINDPDYARKLYLIEHCIYGVDIQPIATQISKLRFFISLVVDQRPTNDAKSNFGIRPLPNLETKFVTANTLIPLDREDNLFTGSDEIRGYEDQLQDINHRIFLAKRNKEKESLRDLMNSTRTMMAQSLENLGFISSKGFDQLVQWNMFDQNASAPFFDSEWMFGALEGFDIVIANPPYISIQGLSEQQKKDYKKLFKFFFHRYDMFGCFIEKGIGLLKEGGILTFIQPSVFLNSKSFMYCRKYLVEDCTLYNLNLLKDGIFESAVVPTMIMLVGKEKSSGHKISCTQGNDLSQIYHINQDSFLKTEANVFNMNLDEKVSSFIEKTEEDCVLLGEIARISNGINTGNLTAYLHDEFEPNTFKVLKGGSINKWTFDYKGLYLDDKMEEFVSCGDLETLGKPKLMMKRIGVFPNVCFDDSGIACLHTIHTIRIESSKYDPKYIMALMNSKLIGKIFRLRVPLKGDVFPEFRVFDLNQQIPIKNVDESIQSYFINIVNQILSSNDNSLISEYERNIDMGCYKLYNLSYEDILFVDPETSITAEEYNTFKID